MTNKHTSFIPINNLHPVLEFKKVHKSLISAVILLHDGRIASAGYDKRIKIFSFILDEQNEKKSKYKCEVIIEGHRDKILNIIQLDNGYLISCSGDKSIIIWSLTVDCYNFIHQIKDAHSNMIYGLAKLSQGRFASGGQDGDIKIWDEKYNLIKTLILSNYLPECMFQMKNQEILLINPNGSLIFVYDTKHYQTIHAIKGVRSYEAHSMMQIDDERVICGGHSDIQIVNIISGIIEQSYNNDLIPRMFSIIRLDEDNFVIGGDEKLLFYNKKMNNGLIKEKAHNMIISDMVKINDKYFIAGDRNGNIKIWSFSKQKCIIF